MKLLKYTSFFIFAILISFTSGFSYNVHKYFNTPTVQADTFFIIQKGSSFKKIVNKMQKDNIIEDNNLMTKVFYYTSLAINKNKINAKAGEYLITSQDTPLKILNKFKSGDVFYRKVTFAEGLSNHSIYRILNATYGLFGNLPNLEKIPEGSLMPETYLYTYGDSKADMINRMQKAMVEFIDKNWEKKASYSPVKTKEELISLASIVERETGVQHERGLIAGVFANRLHKGMRLQSDPTAIYAFTRGNVDLENIISTAKLIKIPSEYNTYMIDGIPKKPIANPGKEAILAVLNPLQTDYLYFVATGSRGHYFSKTYEEHMKFIDSYKKVRKEQSSPKKIK